MTRLRRFWRDPYHLTQACLAFAAGLNVTVALHNSGSLQAVNWFCAGACLGVLSMNYTTNHFYQRCRLLSAALDAMGQVHADDVGRAIAEHMAEQMKAQGSVEVLRPTITRH
jgi:hypothetical protein